MFPEYRDLIAKLRQTDPHLPCLNNIMNLTIKLYAEHR